MSVIGGSSPVISNGLVYALDFGNTKTYISGSSTVKSLTYDPTTTSVNGPFSFDGKNLIFTGTTSTYIQRSGSVVTTNPNSEFTICILTNVIRPGSFLIQNTSTVNFAAQISTSSFDIGFYNTTTATYYTRRFPVTLNTGSLYVACRYSNGSIDLFLNGLPVTSSLANIIMDSQATSSRTNSLTYSTTGSLFLGALPSSVSTFSGSIAQFSLYNRALTSTEIYSNYVPHITSQYQLPVLSQIKPYTLDENTLMYVSASQISSSAYITAIDSFISGLKSAGLWNKLSAIYPVIGSTTASQAINLKEPGINRLVYTGSWSASFSGSAPITTSSYLRLSGFDYPTIATSSAHITYLSYDLPQVTASLVAIDNPLRALGGEIFYSGSNTYHVFRNTGTSSFQAIDSSLTSVEVLTVAGGGAGGNGIQYNGGGGGAGGLIYSSSFTITPGSNIEVIVGSGGAVSTLPASTNGNNSKFSSIVAIGGGRGGSGRSTPGIAGGSGGGGAGTPETLDIPSGLTAGGLGTPGQGNDGAVGQGGNAGRPFGGGGGGGAGTPGFSGSITPLRGSDGGSGSYFAQYAGLNLGFPSGWFAGGGAGSSTQGGSFGGTGGPGGGASAPPFSGPFLDVYNGRSNTGGGGGGCGYNSAPLAGVGGSGIVIVSYNTNQSAFTSSFGISLSGSNIVGNLHSTTNSGISSDANASIGLVTVSRTGSVNISIHKDFNSSVITAPVTASIIGSVYANASNFAGTVNKVSPYTLSYLSYGSGMTPDEVNTYHSLASKLQYDLGRGLLLQGYPAAAAYSLRQISKNYPYAINVRRGDDLQQDIGFVSGDLNTGSLLTFLTASISTSLPGDTATPAVAYSVRKVRTAYTGSAMTVRRDFDDLTFDVGFDVSGNLDTGSLLTNMTASGIVTTLPGDYSGLAAAYSLRKVSSSYLGNAVEVRRASDNYSASIAFDGLGNLNTASLASLIRTGSETPISAYSGLTAAYSVRKVVPGYTGSAIQIQSASATLDIGFNSVGDLDVTAIRTFAGSGDAFVRTWYDQSGNGYNATQTTLAVQPKIYSGSLRSVIYQNGRPAIQWDGINDNFQATLPTIDGLSQMAIISVASPEGPRTINMQYANLYFGQTLSWGSVGHVVGTNGLNYRYGTTQFSNDNNYVASIVNSIYGSYKNGVNEIGRYNGVDVTTSNTKLATLLGNDNVLNIGYGEGATMYKGKQSEILIYFSDQTSNRTYIENNINSYYGIYTPSSATTESAFVKTWYDQSGNNRHATQAVTSSQPQIISNGSIITLNSKPSVEYTGNTGMGLTAVNIPGSTSYSIQSVFSAVEASQFTKLLSIGPDDPTNGVWYTVNTGNTALEWVDNDTGFAGNGYNNPLGPTIISNGRIIPDSITTPNMLFTTLSPSNAQMFKNGTEISYRVQRSGSCYNTTGDLILGNSPNSLNTFNGRMQEILIWQSVMTSSRGLIEDNTNGYYNIFTQSLASGSGYVTRWYDQSGNNSHATQSVANFQPLILSSGSIVTQSGKPTLRLDGVDDYLYSDFATISQPNSYFITTTQPADSYGFIFDANTPNRQGLLQSNPVGGLEFFDGSSINAANGTTVGNTRYLYSATANGTNSYVYLNSNLIASGNVGSSGISDLFIGTRYTLQNYGNLNIQEFILYSSDQSANRPSINNNINNYFNIYNLNSSTSSLFVTKWYDQSGNSKHAIQTTNTKQPIIVLSGSVFLENNKPAILFPNTTQQGFVAGTITSTPSDYNIFYVKNQKGGGNPWLLIFGNASYLTQTYPGNATTYYLLDGAGYNLTGTSATPQRQHVGEIYLNSSNNSDSRAYENNGLQKQGFTTGTYTKVAIPNLQISSWDYGTYTGSAQEIIISTNNHLPNRSDIVSNINSYYRIY